MTDPATVPDYAAARIVCAGVVRSGSTWAFNVVRRLLEFAPPERPVAWEWAESNELDIAVWRTLGNEHHVIKCHEESDGFVSALEARFVNGLVFSVRDPMASLASCIEQFVNREPFSLHWTFEVALGHIEGGLKLARRVADRQDVVFVDLHGDGEATSVQRIVDFMGLPLDPADVASVQEQFSFSRMRDRSSRVATESPDALLNGINDPVTFMHANHVDKGNDRDWRHELTEQQIAVASNRFAPYADLIGTRDAATTLRWTGGLGGARDDRLRISCS